MFHNGRLVGTHRDGKHAFWSAAGEVEWLRVDTNEQLIDVSGQEIITSDKVSLRVNLLVTYQVADAVKAATVVENYGQALYREAQLALRAVVGTRSLDVLLADKEAIGGGGAQCAATAGGRLRRRHQERGPTRHHSPRGNERHPQPGHHSGERGPGQHHQAA